jgi:hypothetical protein
MREDALLAEGATTARLDARDDHLVAGGEPGHIAADVGDRADALVTEDPAWCNSRHVALQDVQIGPTDRSRVDPYDCIRRPLNLRLGHIAPRLLARAVIHKRFHGAPLPDRLGIRMRDSTADTTLRTMGFPEALSAPTICPRRAREPHSSW